MRFEPTNPLRQRPPLVVGGYLLTVILIVSALMSGCSYITPDPSVTQLPDHSATLLSGSPSVEAVHRAMGAPWLVSASWGVEIYRDVRTQTEIMTAIIIPYGRLQDDIYRYTLVTYDDNGLATATASGIYRKPSRWRTSQPIELKDMDLFLQAGDFFFTAGWEDRHETLMISPAARDDFLMTTDQSPKATVVIGCGLNLCPAQLSVDGGPTLLIPFRLEREIPAGSAPLITENGEDSPARRPASESFPVRDTVAAMRLSPGTHTLKSWGGRWQQGDLAGLIRGDGSISLSCRAGEVIYVVIDVSAHEYSWSGGAKDTLWDIIAQSTMPVFFRDRPMIIYRDDQWLIEP